MTTIKSDLLDEEFILDRLVECLSICSFQARRSFENEHLFHFSYEQAKHWLNRYELLLGADSHKVIYIESKLAIFRASFVEHEILLELESEEQEAVQVHNAKNQQVFKAAASSQLPVFRLLGQGFTTCTLCNQNKAVSIPSRFWFIRPVPTCFTKQFLSYFRPVGGLA